MNAPRHIESGYLQSGDGQIYVSYHSAKQSGSGNCAILISPHVEERKSAYRLLYELASLLSEAGWDACRFDPRGVGESTGAHRDLTLEGWAEDCGAVADDCSGGRNLWLVGARLGANVALRAAAENPSVKGVVLWEPLLTGEAYLHDMIRRKQIKEMMGQGQAESNEDDLEGLWASGGSVDFDGFEMGPGLRAELANLVLSDDLKRTANLNVLLCHTGGARSFSGAWSDVPDLFQPPSEAACIRQKPFWGLLDYQENSELKEKTLDYMETHA